MKYRNFICYRGGSSAGIHVGKDLYKKLHKEENDIGLTYYSPSKEDATEIRNFLLDPHRILGDVENFIVLLTSDFFKDFLLEDNSLNPESVTLIELKEAFTNPNTKFVPLVFEDFHWTDHTGLLTNAEILNRIYGEDSSKRLIGAPPIKYMLKYEEQGFNYVYDELLSHVSKTKKVVIFDFDGTLTDSKIDNNTWEIVWTTLGYDIKECEKLHARFSRKEISHEEWCSLTSDRFIEKGCSRQLLKDISLKATLVADTKEVIFELYNKGITLYILSGSIIQYIKDVLGKELVNCFKEIRANKFSFDEDGMLDGIIGTPYDFEGKARFVKKVIEELNVEPKDILFVGNSFNDEFVYKTGVCTLCINPKRTDFYNNKIWHDYIRNLVSLKEILPYVYGEK